ncbi:hypothetical protein P3X46_000594 [Hevea brasiliensis]|uniref:UBX domain-containing protein n=2 Tax=Hevea brasiliensis TaxID=3981 RepID=A0ABQ9NC53_HEVBR|nr:plant UBX domain-containing protein 11 isoform X2 [Hevea brasiliensis]XP_058001239.1 plant UBX domain-containing protein 11 isoform X2 [Hevea brasiliensis]KAJ9189282.1 hypothetical protein P3X46_000594 [Hevea brasiliensis]
MENSLSALTYKGSISEAILESKKQKKLFVVYISGSDENSVELEKSTWTDSKVGESLSKYCIFLHIPEASTDASNFSAIYPQKSAPSITAIGYNGIQLWKSEGIVGAEALASSLEKAWLSLHIQETTATVLTAALTSKKPEPSAGFSDISSSEQGSSSGTIVPPPLVDKHEQSSDGGPSATSETIEENNSHEHIVEGKSTKYEDKASSKSTNADKSLGVGAEQSTSLSAETKGLSSPLRLDPDSPVADGLSSSNEDEHTDQEKIINQYSVVPGGDSQLVTTETIEATQRSGECVDDRKTNTLDNDKSVNALSEVHLNIRLPSGISLQDKFSVKSTLGMIKDYVDRNQASEIGSYDLAIPYPRKVFSNQDLSKSLSELGLFDRQALIVVPHQRATNYHRGGSSSDQTAATTYSDSSITNNGGYFVYLKRMLSYINPLSYLGGSTSPSSSGQPQTGVWEYSPNPALQNNLTRSERPYSSYSPNQSTSSTGRNDNRSRQPTTSHFGSNIHTLKHDEDDSQFGDRNPFWNGNSTQYGGNSDGK